MNDDKGKIIFLPFFIPFISFPAFYYIVFSSLVYPTVISLTTPSLLNVKTFTILTLIQASLL
jgi:hypothetical protein